MKVALVTYLESVSLAHKKKGDNQTVSSVVIHFNMSFYINDRKDW